MYEFKKIISVLFLLIASFGVHAQVSTKIEVVSLNNDTDRDRPYVQATTGVRISSAPTILGKGRTGTVVFQAIPYAAGTYSMQTKYVRFTTSGAGKTYSVNMTATRAKAGGPCAFSGSGFSTGSGTSVSFSGVQTKGNCGLATSVLQIYQ